MGAVYKALDLQLSRREVAIKEMSQSGLVGQELQQAISAFTREAQMLSQLKHVGLPHIYGQFEEHGRRYLVMEFIEGKTLELHLESIRAQGNCLSLPRIIDIGKQLCSVLEYLHTQRPPIVFRDLKPSNIMLNAQGKVYLIDFGIARWFTPGQSKDTNALGSHGYAPPEQYRQATSPRSDIYSLGATLYQLLTGDDPSQHPFSFRPFSVNLPTLEQLVSRMVSLDEKRRPRNMREVYKTLDGLFGGSGSAPVKDPGALRSSPVPSSLSLYVVVSSTLEDQQLWENLRTQLVSALESFPQVGIESLSLASGGLQEALDKVDQAHLTLLLLSEDFLATPECLAATDRAIRRYNRRQARVYALSLRPYQHRNTSLEQVQVLTADPLAHPSRYVREQRSLSAALAIRSFLVTVLLAGKRAGPMNLFQWLLCQLYGDSRNACPYFATGTHVIHFMRRTAFTGIFVELFDQHSQHILGSYRIGPIACQGLSDLLQSITPHQTDPAQVRGVATWKSPFNSCRK